MLERMTSYAKAFHSATGVAGDTMQRRIALYWASLILVVFAAFFSVVAILGFFSAGEQKLCESMMSHHKSVVLSIEEQVDMLSAHSLVLSSKVSLAIEQELRGDSVQSLSDVAPTGVSEIDALVSFLDGRENNQTKDLVAPEVLELLDDFAGLFGALTATERTIAKLYEDGYEVHDVADMLFISIHTVRKHNANIYRKLGIGSREELTLYIEIFRRSDRLGDLFGGEEES